MTLARAGEGLAESSEPPELARLKRCMAKWLRGNGLPFFQGYGFRQPGRQAMLHGITRQLAARFWPQGLPASAGSSGSGGRAKGSALHADLERAALTGLPARTPQGRAVLESLAAAGLRPVTAELVVAFNGYGTAVDLVCRDAGGHLVLCELKSGMASSFGHPRGMMGGGLARLPLSQLNAALVQIVVAQVMACATHGMVFAGPRPPLVIWASARGVGLVRVSAAVYAEVLPAAVDFLADGPPVATAAARAAC